MALTKDAELADELHARSRALLVSAVRRGHAAGMSQRDIAEAVGRSQPEVSRLLRFHGSTSRGRLLEGSRADVLSTIRAHGGRRPQVFGSVARGEDNEHSDIDLLVDFADPPSLMQIARLEADVSAVLGCPVDVVPVSSLRASMRERILEEAIPL